MENLPIEWQDKVNSPELLALLQNFGATHYLSAEEVNQLRDAVNELFISVGEGLGGVTAEDLALKLSKGAYTGTAQDLKNEIDALSVALPTEYTTIVYINDTDPATATVFDTENPPVTNDDLLKEDTDNLYIGDDSSTWVWNGLIYTTKVVPELSNFTINGTPVDAGSNKTSPISRLAPVTVQEKINDTADNSGSSLNTRHIGMWRWLTGVAKYARIKWDNIGNNVIFQLPATADNSTETFAMVSDLDDKLDKDGYTGTAQDLKDYIDTKLDAADYNQHFKGVYLTEAALITAHPTGVAGDSAQVNAIGSPAVVNYNWDAEAEVWVMNATGGGSGAANTDELPEGSTHLYWTVARFLANLTAANIKAALGITTLYGNNTGDQDLSEYATLEIADTAIHKTGNETKTGNLGIVGYFDVDSGIDGISGFILKRLPNTVTISSNVFAEVGNFPQEAIFDTSGNLYVSNNTSGTISKITPAGVVSIFATLGGNPDNMIFDASDNLYVAIGNSNTVKKITPVGVVTTFIVGTDPESLVFDTAGNLYVSNFNSFSISKITPAGVVTTFATNMGGNPGAMKFNAVGDLFVIIPNSNLIKKITPSGIITTFATGVVLSLSSIVMDASENMYVLGYSISTSGIIQKITPAGVVTTFATNMGLSCLGLIMDASDNLYASSSGNYQVKKITPVGVVTTHAFLIPSAGPRGLALDTIGDLYIVASGTDNVLKTDVSTGAKALITSPTGEVIKATYLEDVQYVKIGNIPPSTSFNGFPLPLANACSGEFVYFGTGTTVAGNLYKYNTSGAWVPFDANSTTTSIGLLAIAQSTTPAGGMMVKGYARFSGQSSYSTPAVGTMLFGSETVGAFTGTAPTTSASIIRIIGFCIDATNDIIYFNPDNTWIELN